MQIAYATKPQKRQYQKAAEYQGTELQQSNKVNINFYYCFQLLLKCIFRSLVLTELAFIIVFIVFLSLLEYFPNH